MLKKLVKYELKSTSKEFFILYLAFFILTILNKIYFDYIIFADHIRIFKNSILYGILDQLYHVLISTYYFLCAGIFFITFALILIRFYKNLVGNEGYLTFTLPVPTWMIILSKLISAAIWFVCSLFVFLLSQIILFWKNGAKEFIKSFFSEFINTHFLYLFGLILLILFLIALFLCTTAEFYFCIAVGHLAKKHRMISAVITFFIYNFIKTYFIAYFALRYLLFIGEKTSDLLDSFYQTQKDLTFILFFDLNIGILILLIFILISILSFITIRIFQNHLNLE